MGIHTGVCSLSLSLSLSLPLSLSLSLSLSLPPSRSSTDLACIHGVHQPTCVWSEAESVSNPFYTQGKPLRSKKLDADLETLARLWNTDAFALQ